jgi:hypothetical protein
MAVLGRGLPGQRQAVGAHLALVRQHDAVPRQRVVIGRRALSVPLLARDMASTHRHINDLAEGSRVGRRPPLRLSTWAWICVLVIERSLFGGRIPWTIRS